MKLTLVGVNICLEFNTAFLFRSPSISDLLFLSYCSAGISNSFGFGGHNSVVVFAPFKP
jgi:hypothetical protein